MISLFLQGNDKTTRKTSLSLRTIVLIVFVSTQAFSFQSPIHSSTRSQRRHTPIIKPSTAALHAFLDPSVLALDSLISPYATAALTCGVKASAADYVAQRKDARKMDLRRNFGFALYGALYQGMALELIYNGIYPIFFGTGTGVLTVTAKVVFNLLVQSVFLTLPLAYLIKGWFENRTLKQSLNSYGKDVQSKGLLRKYFLFWGPAQFITFRFIPEHFRISFIASLSFFWMIVLSRLSSSSAPIGERKNVR